MEEDKDPDDGYGDEGDFQGAVGDDDDSFDSDFDDAEVEAEAAEVGEDDEIDLEAYLKWR